MFVVGDCMIEDFEDVKFDEIFDFIVFVYCEYDMMV